MKERVPNQNEEVECPECGFQTIHATLERHLETCMEVVIPCPQGCFAQIKKKDKDDHLKTECPLTLVPCKFGCEEQLLRTELEDHMKQNSDKHLNMLLEKVEVQAKQIKGLERKCFGRMLSPRAIAIGLVSIVLLMWLRISFPPLLCLAGFLCFILMKRGKQPKPVKNENSKKNKNKKDNKENKENKENEKNKENINESKTTGTKKNVKLPI